MTKDVFLSRCSGSETRCRWVVLPTASSSVTDVDTEGSIVFGALFAILVAIGFLL